MIKLKEINVKYDFDEVDTLYESIISLCHSFHTIDTNKKSLTKKIELLITSRNHDENIVAMLRESNVKISNELTKSRKEYGAVENEMKSVGELADKIDKMDFIKSRLSGIRRVNAGLQLKLIPIAAKVEKLQEELFDLRKKKQNIVSRHTELMMKSSEFARLRTKIMPKGELLELRDRFAEESAKLEKYIKSRIVENLKEELSRIVPERDELKQELETTIAKLLSVGESIKSLETQINKMLPKVIAEKDAEELEENVGKLRKQKNELTKEKTELSPRIATLAGDEENITTILESLKLKTKRDREKLASLKKEMDELKIDKNSITQFDEKVRTQEEELFVRKGILDSLKKEYEELKDKNRKYKATIDEVNKITDKLKKQIGN